jgi:glycosyltransferase involved in cell wall biosynthesis
LIHSNVEFLLHATQMAQARVTILTPVYNGEQYLAECIESVLAQDYTDWEYHIANNCSTDRSLEIAQTYARKDPRIHVHTNASFVSAIENHNIAFRLVPTESRYCKVVSADDWIYPKCLGKMVALADTYPNLGIVGCYQQSGKTIKWRGLPPTVSVVSGREAARIGLLQAVHILGTPTSVLYRADLVKKRDSFFPHNRSYADTSACYECFQDADFGFLHEVLAVERVHEEQWSTAMDRLDAGSVGSLDILLRYGPIFLTEAEFAARRKEVFDAYYRGLGGCILKLKSREFWNFHRSRLREMGIDLPWNRVAREAIKEVATEAKNPAAAIRKVIAVLKGKPTDGVCL